MAIDNQVDGSTVLATIRAERDKLEALIAGLDEARLQQPGVEDAWSIKDILAHLTAWERRLTIRLEAVARDEQPEIEPIAEGDAAMHAFNARTFEANRDRSLDAVRAEARQSYDAVLRAVEQVRARLSTGTSAAVAELRDRIAVNTYEHYREHAEAIRAWLERVRA